MGVDRATMSTANSQICETFGQKMSQKVKLRKPAMISAIKGTQKILVMRSQKHSLLRNPHDSSSIAFHYGVMNLNYRI